ncbi:hypothetical protein LXL04_001862 [Taraxacum kok-saghyz]
MHKQTIYVFNVGHHFNTRSQQFLSVLLLLPPSKSNCNRIAHNPHISPTLSGLSTYKYNRQSDRIGNGERERERERERYAKEERKERDQRQRVFPAAVDHLRRNLAMEIRLLQPSPYPLHFLTQTKAHTEVRNRLVCAVSILGFPFFVQDSQPNLPKPGLAQFSNQDVFPTG